jgi:hypothetical protein
LIDPCQRHNAPRYRLSFWSPPRHRAGTHRAKRLDLSVISSGCPTACANTRKASTMMRSHSRCAACSSTSRRERYIQIWMPTHLPRSLMSASRLGRYMGADRRSLLGRRRRTCAAYGLRGRGQNAGQDWERVQGKSWWLSPAKGFRYFFSTTPDSQQSGATSTRFLSGVMPEARLEARGAGEAALADFPAELHPPLSLGRRFVKTRTYEASQERKLLHRRLEPNCHGSALGRRTRLIRPLKLGGLWQSLLSRRQTDL